jgi:GAF domain-containing protein
LLDNLSFIWMPIGLTYGAFGRRFLDVGFVVNRVAVYTGVSLVVVSIFVLAEYLLTDLLGASRNENVIIGAAVALGLGLSMRFIHQYVDRFLDNVFFRKRHEAEQALRAFAHEASFISDPAIVLDRARTIIEQRADASSVIFALHDGAGRYGEFDGNDPAIVSLRAWRKPLDLRDIDSQMQGELAYPMFARGRMVGALVIGPKRSGDSYAPDESNAIAELAHGVGLALEALTTQRTDRAEIIAAMKEALAQALAAGVQ